MAPRCPMRRITRFCLADARVTNLDFVRFGPALLLVMVFACAAPTPAPSAAPVRAVGGALERVILQSADVPADYVIEKDEPMSQDDLANGLGTTPVQLKQRLAIGYVRVFTKGGEPFGWCVMDSIPTPTADEATGRASR